MIVAPDSAADRFEDLYLHADGIDPLPRALALGPLSDEDLADLIFRDGQARLARGLAVNFERYTSAVRDLEDRPAALDAAISVSIRDRMAQGHTLDQAAEDLVGDHPHLRTAITEAVILDRAFSTSALGAASPRRAAVTVPGPFGEKLSGGAARYRLVRELGRGAFATVYLAEDSLLSTEDTPALVAIKVAHHTTPDGTIRFEIASEAARARSIDHPNTIRIFDRGVTPDRLEYLVCEYAAGGPISDHHLAAPPPRGERSPPSRTDSVVRLGIGIAHGLNAIHLAGLVHRDLKPANVLLSADGTPKIGDFGIALPISPALAPDAGPPHGNASGSLAFMAPERVRCDPGCNTPRADLYSLGALLIHLLTGRLVNGTSPAEIRHNAWSRQQPTPNALADSLRSDGVPGDLAMILARCVNPNPKDRQESAAAFADDLTRWRDRTPITWLHRTRRSRLRLGVRRNPVAAALLAFLVLATAAAMIGTMVAAAAVARDRHRSNLVREALDQSIASLGTAIQKDPHLDARYLLQLHVIDSIVDKSLVFDSDTGAFIGRARRDLVKQRIERAEARGESDDVLTWLWRLNLGYWDYRSNTRSPELRGMLADTEAALTRLLGPDAALTKAARVLAICDDYDAASRGTSGPVSSVRAALSVPALRALLESELDCLEHWNQDGPLLNVVRETLKRGAAAR